MDAATIHERRWWTLGVLSVSLLIIGIDNTILNVALPTLQEHFSASSSQLQWFVDSYVIVFASLLLTMGSLGDRFGRKGALDLGLIIFGAASVGAAFAPSAGALIAFRGLMGIGGALIMPATLSILTNVFTEPGERGRAIGIWAGVSGLGIAIGPVVGGWLLENFWWGSVFHVNIPVVVIALIASRRLVPTSRDPHAPRLDLLGTVLSFGGLAALLYGIIEAPSHGWNDTGVLAGFSAGIVLLAAFVAWELRTDHPVLDVRFFRNPRFSGASIAITLVFFAMFGSIYFLTQYLQFTMGYTALQAGLRTAPVALTIMVAAPLSSLFNRKVGTKVTVASGLVVVAGALLLLSTATPTSGYGLVLASILMLGIGMGTAMAPATDSIMGSLPKEKAGVGSAVNDTTREIGGALGVAILGSLTAAAYHSSMDSSGVLALLPEQAREAARDNVGGAIEVARRIGAQAQPLVTEANEAFVNAMSGTLRIAALIALAGALVAAIFLPSRPGREPELDTDLQGEGDEQFALAD